MAHQRARPTWPSLPQQEHMNNDALIIKTLLYMLYELNGNTVVYTNLMKSCHFVPCGKKLQPTPVSQ